MSWSAIQIFFSVPPFRKCDLALITKKKKTPVLSKEKIVISEAAANETGGLRADLAPGYQWMNRQMQG